jgi:hypothetical protein
VPLVGVWIKGARSVNDPIVYISCLRYGFSSGFPDMATQHPPEAGVEGGGAFLLLLFPNGEDSTL